MNGRRILTARRVHTMEPATDRGWDAVLIDGDRISAVGTLAQLRAEHDAPVDDRFEDRVLLPGFIDPHLHPSMAAVLLQMHFTTIVSWDLPWANVGPIRNQGEFDRQLAAIVSETPAGDPVFVWGHHPRWHGDIDRAALNGVSEDHPVIVWHRGYHSLIVNDAAMDWMGVDREEAERHPQIDLDRGAFFENGLMIANQLLTRHTLVSERFRGGLERMRSVIHAGGHTTIGDAAFGMYQPDQEWEDLQAVMERPDTPFRIDLMPALLASMSLEDRIASIRDFPSRNTHRLRFGNHVKMLADGAFFAELMQLQEPGYLDGHHGEWLTAPEQFREIASAAWDAGFHIHVHTTGDLGVELALSTLEELQARAPRDDHRFTFEHFGLSTPEQVERIAAQGAQVSANVYYVHELAPTYAELVLGHDRASTMSRLGSLEAAGIPFALHSDFTMAPAKPLFNAWVAATRLCENDEVMGADERTSLDAAMRAITIDAARMLSRENEIGSITPGKMADMTVLAEDPWEIGPEGLRDIPVVATVFEGASFDVPTT